MNTTNPIAVRGVSTVAVEIQSEAYNRRSEIIEIAQFCPPTVTDADTQAEVTNAVRDIRRLLKEVEDGRKTVKAPVLDIGRKIDGAAEEFCQPLIVEEKRLTGLLTSYQVEQQRIAREAEAKRQAELARQQEEERKRQAEIDRQAREADLAKAQAELKAREATDAESRAKAQQEAKEAADKTTALAAQRAKEAAAAKLEQAELMRAPSPVVPKAAGTSVSAPWVFEVTDAKALHAARPELVDLVVRRNDIITRIRQGEREIPGLRIYQDTKVVVRT